MSRSKVQSSKFKVQSRRQDAAKVQSPSAFAALRRDKKSKVQNRTRDAVQFKVQSPKFKVQSPQSTVQSPRSTVQSPLLVLLSAPSGGGKTTLCQQLLQARRDMTRAITCTTREPRPGEKDGVDYYFLDAADFLKRVQAGNFLEHATVFGNSYGTLKSEVLNKLRHRKDVLLNVDVQGAAFIRARAEEDTELKRSLITVFLTPPSVAILEKRLKKRGTESLATIQKRLAVARQEIAQWKNFDYLIISNSIQEDLRRMQAIIEGEKMRTERAVAPEL